MADLKPDVRAIFGEALDQKSPDAIKTYLDTACGDDDQLRAQVEALLSAHGEVGNFLGGGSAPGFGSTLAPITEQAGSILGPYKLLQQIGEGGMGVVYMAEQTEPVERRVALKIIKLGMDTRQVIARFEAERQALAMMEHPHIAKVLDAGTSDSGRPYFVMELVRGVPITKYCDEQHLTARQRLELFLPVCRAVQHAHQKGIIHRDLKPSNVMVALYDDRPVPKVIDFGVAKATSQKLTEKTMFTQYGQVVGTLEYMSPEQAKLNQLDVDTRSDVYSLGVLLYELLTGTTPFDKQRLRSSAFEEMLRIIREEEPPKPSTRLRSSATLPAIATNRGTEPRKLSALIRGELDWIVMKALEKDRTRRYETANGLAVDIEHYLNDEQVVACPPSSAYKFRKFARRNRAALTTAAIVITALLLGSGVSTWQAIRATNAQGKAEREAQRADAEAERSQQAAEQERIERLRAVQAERRVRRQAYVADMAYACRILRAGEMEPIPNLLDRHLPDSTTDLRGLEWYYLWQHCHVDVLKLQTWGRVESLAFSTDGKMLATGCGDTFTIGEIKLWEPATGKLLRSFKGHAGVPSALAFSTDGKTLASATRRGVKLWDVEDGSQRSTLRTHYAHGSVYDLAFSPDGQALAVVEKTKKNRILTIIDVASGQEQSSSQSALDLVTFSPDGDRLAAIDSQGRLLLSNTADVQNAVAVPLNHVGPISCFRFAPDSARLTIGSMDGAVHVLDVNTRQLLSSYRHHKDAVRAVGFSSQGDRIVSSSADALAVWDDNTKDLLATYPGTGTTKSTFSPDGKMLASGTWNQFATVRRIGLDAAIGTIEVHAGGRLTQAFHVAFSPDGKRLASVTTGEVALCEVTTGKKIVSQPVRGQGAVGFGFSREGRAVAASVEGTKMRLWDVETGQHFMTLDGDVDAGNTSCITFSLDQRTLALGTLDGTLWLWDLDSGRLLGMRKEHRLQIYCIAFSADGDTVASGGLDEVIRLWDRDTCTVHGTLQGHADGVASLAFSPTDTNTLASGSFDRTVRLWDLDAGRLRATLEGHAPLLWALAFSPDGRRLAASGPDCVKLWDPNTGDEVGSIGQTRPDALAFSTDGNQLATWTRRQKARILQFAMADDVKAELDQRPIRTENLMRQTETISVVKQAVLSARVRAWRDVEMHDDIPFQQRKEALESAFQQLQIAPEYYAIYAPRICASLAMVLSSAPNERLRAPHRVSQLMSEALRLAPHDPDLWISIGRVRSNQGNWPAAKDAYENAVQHSVYRAVSVNALAWFLATCPDEKMRDPDRAVQLAREAKNLRPSQSSFWKTLGIALYRRGNWQEAIDALTKSHETEAIDSIIDCYLFLAMSHWQLDNKEQAQKWYADAMSLLETENLAGHQEELGSFQFEAAHLMDAAD